MKPVKPLLFAASLMLSCNDELGGSDLGESDLGATRVECQRLDNLPNSKPVYGLIEGYDPDELNVLECVSYTYPAGCTDEVCYEAGERTMCDYAKVTSREEGSVAVCLQYLEVLNDVYGVYTDYTNVQGYILYKPF